MIHLRRIFEADEAQKVSLCGKRIKWETGTSNPRYCDCPDCKRRLVILLSIKSES